MENGFFKRKGGGFKDRNNDRDRGNDRERGGFNRERGGEFRDRNRDTRGGGFSRDRGDARDKGGFNRERGGDFRDRGEIEESVFSKRVRAGKRRTYFFDVRQTRSDDYFITITESTRREDGYGYKRHKLFLYKEDFNRFVECLNEVVNHVKTELMPDFDYEEFDRRQAEWEAQHAEGGFEDDAAFDDEAETGEDEPDSDDRPAKRDNEDDMNW